LPVEEDDSEYHTGCSYVRYAVFVVFLTARHVFSILAAPGCRKGYEIQLVSYVEFPRISLQSSTSTQTSAVPGFSMVKAACLSSFVLHKSDIVLRNESPFLHRRRTDVILRSFHKTENIFGIGKYCCKYAVISGS